MNWRRAYVIPLRDVQEALKLLQFACDLPVDYQDGSTLRLRLWSGSAPCLHTPRERSVRIAAAA